MAMAYAQIESKTAPAVKRIAEAKAEAERKKPNQTMAGGRGNDIQRSRRR